jgi:hypothetical protein
MSGIGSTALSKSALRLLRELAANGIAPGTFVRTASRKSTDVEQLLRADLIRRTSEGELGVSAAGHAYLARLAAVRWGADIDPFRAQHLDLAEARTERQEGASAVLVDGAESPLAWLARRKGRDGRAFIETWQFLAGERLRGEFTRAQLMPRVTSNWQAPIGRNRRGGDFEGPLNDTVITARQRFQHALDAVGPEFSGLLVDVCCFLKRLDDVERERRWPPRSAKIVLQLGLDRLARHYGYGQEARGAESRRLRVWMAEAFAAE